MAFQVLNEIGIINQLATNKFEQVMPHGLTISQFQVLNHFVRLGGEALMEKNLGALARAFQVSKATISGVVANLERKGFVALRQDPDDGRGRLASITPAGRAAHAESIAAIEPHLAKMREALPEGTFEGLLPALVLLRRYLDDNR